MLLHLLCYFFRHQQSVSNGESGDLLRDPKKLAANVAAWLQANSPYLPTYTHRQIPNLILPPLFTSFGFKRTQINPPAHAQVHPGGANLEESARLMARWLYIFCQISGLILLSH